MFSEAYLLWELTDEQWNRDSFVCLGTDIFLELLPLPLCFTSKQEFYYD